VNLNTNDKRKQKPSLVPEMLDSNKNVPKPASFRLMEELIIIGPTPEIRENMRTFPSNWNVTFKAKLAYSYPKSELR